MEKKYFRRFNMLLNFKNHKRLLFQDYNFNAHKFNNFAENY